MSTALTWHEIALRLGLTIVAGALFGFNRTERGRPAGMRTTMLVCLAASVAMLQVNLLLGLAGRPNNSFVMNDLMRLPLGILSGMGFIGAGTIVRRENFVVGVTTAATLWLVTVLGLCFGGGQLGIGIVGTVIGIVVLWWLEWVEAMLKQVRNATMELVIQSNGPTENDIRARVQAAGFRVTSWEVNYINFDNRQEFCCGIEWRGRIDETLPPPFLAELAKQPGVLTVHWKP